MTDPRIEVYQAEWCPYSSLVRQKLTELQLPWIAVPVPAERADRTAMREATGSDSIPVVVVDGEALAGDAAEIVEQLAARFEAGAQAEAHRQQAEAHGTSVG